MPDLVERTPAATAWMAHALAAFQNNAVFGQVRPAVIWTDATDTQGKLIVPLDPTELAAQINQASYPLQVGHDPGRPMGAMVAAEAFKSPAGERFVAAVVGFYDGAPRVGFRDLDLDLAAPIVSPDRLPGLPGNFRLYLAADPREVSASWLADVMLDAPFEVEFDERSYNAAEAPHQFISVAVAYLMLVWNPFSKAFIEAAGKDAYAAAHAWIRRLIERVARLQNPVLEISSSQRGCAVSFMIRSRDVELNYKAHNALAETAQRAARLIDHMTTAGIAPKRLVYEFDAASGAWFPSFAELGDGRLMTDNAELIAAEHVPMQLSLGGSVKSVETPQRDPKSAAQIANGHS